MWCFIVNETKHLTLKKKSWNLAIEHANRLTYEQIRLGLQEQFGVLAMKLAVITD